MVVSVEPTTVVVEGCAAKAQQQTDKEGAVRNPTGRKWVSRCIIGFTSRGKINEKKRDIASDSFIFVTLGSGYASGILQGRGIGGQTSENNRPIQPLPTCQHPTPGHRKQSET